MGSLCLHPFVVLSLVVVLTQAEGPQSAPDAVQAAQAPPPIDRPELFVPRDPRTAEEVEQLDATRRYAAARALEANREWTEAVELLERARQFEPDSVAILRRLSRLYFGLGGEDRIPRAVETGEAALEADPEDPETIRRLVRHFRTSNDLDAAESILRSTLENPKLSPFSVARLVILHELGRLYIDTQRSDEAVEPLDQLVRALDTKEATRLTPAQVQDILGEDESDAYRRFGETFFNSGRYDLAITALRRSLAYDPDSQQTPLYLAQALLRADRAAEALELLGPIVASRPPGRVTFDVLAQVLSALGEDEQIIPRLEDASEADPSNVLLRYALAERYEANGRDDEARRLYREIISDQPDQGVPALAQSMLEQEKYEEMLQLFETAQSQRGGRMAIDPQLRLIGTDPTLAAAVIEVGMELLRADPPRLGPSGIDLLTEIASRADLPGPRVELDRLSLERDPSPQNYLELADSLVSAGRPAEAVAIFEEMIGKFPELGQEPQLLTRIAELQLDSGRVEDALSNGRKLLEQRPDDLPVIQLVGYALQRLGRYDEAIELYDQVPDRFVGVPDALRLARIWKANALASSDRFEQGESILLELLEEQPDDPWIANDLGYLWAERGIKLDRAEELTRTAVEADPENSAYLDSLGWVLYKLGRPEEALPHLEKAVGIRPSAVNLDHLGDVYFGLGRSDAARDCWSRAAELAEDAEPPDPSLADIREKLQALGDADPIGDPVDANP
ncbi:tetratricopeptide repeat protein [Tautonia plasticadhaerens]|uniref:Tetratricopeptide repeat protein n=2 Tax=Tautonia plasticadhaerens TaxID=2527974 RepID=A0A518H9F7_9BACT|nr:tetratricopeptide repeat protein [Tautonia plasticadhaerens]